MSCIMATAVHFVYTVKKLSSIQVFRLRWCSHNPLFYTTFISVSEKCLSLDLKQLTALNASRYFSQMLLNAQAFKRPHLSHIR